jgi:hypothetical protein
MQANQKTEAQPPFPPLSNLMCMWRLLSRLSVLKLHRLWRLCIQRNKWSLRSLLRMARLHRHEHHTPGEKRRLRVLDSILPRKFRAPATPSDHALFYYFRLEDQIPEKPPIVTALFFQLELLVGHKRAEDFSLRPSPFNFKQMPQPPGAFASDV